jgi:hypothetical protein
MAVNLQKGAKISLTKGNDGIQNVRAGLKWESKCDVDASILMLDENKKMTEIVYFGKNVTWIVDDFLNFTGSRNSTNHIVVFAVDHITDLQPLIGESRVPLDLFEDFIFHDYSPSIYY